MPHFSDRVLLESTFSQMREVSLAGCCLVTDRGLTNLLQEAPSLQKLDVSGCSGVTEALLLRLADPHIPCRICVLAVSGCIKVGDRGLSALCLSPQAHSLLELGLSGCSMLTDLSLETLGRLSRLQKLSIRGCDQASDRAILAIAAGCRALRCTPPPLLPLSLGFIAWLAGSWRWTTSTW
jgi:F-box and leucine-rich repeat protein 1 (S-phase kinase-associated protein 2)